MKYLKIVALIIYALTFAKVTYGQILIKELAGKKVTSPDSVFINKTRTRDVISLKGRWYAYLPDEKDKRTIVTIPSNFRGKEELTFEREIPLSQSQIANHTLELQFLGLNYSADISVNNYIIYKHPGGEFPFRVELPRDILKARGRNILAVRIYHKLNSETTIPVTQRFLYPQNLPGIFRDVFINVMPNVSVSSMDFSYKVQNGRVALKVNSRLENNGAEARGDSLGKQNEYSYRVRLISPQGGEIFSAPTAPFVLNPKKDRSFSQTYDIASPVLWTPQAPVSYRLSVQILQGERVVDEIVKPVAFFSLNPYRDNLSLNGQPFIIHGTTYIPSFKDYGNLADYGQMERDLRIIKDMGFNAVRFEKVAPHPYLLSLCQKLGLLAFIEIPVNSIPQSISSKENFRKQAESYLSQFIKGYKEYSAVAAIGLGGSYTAGSAEHASILQVLADFVKKNTSKPVYASFVGSRIEYIDGIDFYGFEVFNKQINDISSIYNEIENRLGKGRVFISEATYASYAGSTNGYLNPFSNEAQAVFFSDLIDFTVNGRNSGYFINSAFDYRGDYVSLTAGYNPEGIYRIGILGENRASDRLGQKVIYSKLHDGEKVTIPMGTKRDDSPIIFIVYGVSLALIMGFLINSKKKFREDATRALLRPYNFYADIRDQRILSGFHSNFLMVVLAICSALLQGNLLYYFRGSVFLEKAILSFGSPKLSKLISYLAWNPTESLLWLTGLSIIFFIAASVVIKIGSFFIKNRVHFSSIYFMVIWSFLPLILLLPLGLVLYKILNADVITLYLLIALLVFTVWIFYRLMKGIYVIFDVDPGPVYFYSLFILFVIIGSILLYFQLTESTVYYMIDAYKQYRLM